MFFDRIAEFHDYYDFHNFVHNVKKSYRSIDFEKEIIEFV